MWRESQKKLSLPFNMGFPVGSTGSKSGFGFLFFLSHVFVFYIFFKDFFRGFLFGFFTFSQQVYLLLQNKYFKNTDQNKLGYFTLLTLFENSFCLTGSFFLTLENSPSKTRTRIQAESQVIPTETAAPALLHEGTNSCASTATMKARSSMLQVLG
jgi:hypothetical protein